MSNRQLTPEHRRWYIATGVIDILCAVMIARNLVHATGWTDYSIGLSLSILLVFCSVVYSYHAWHNRYL